MKRNIKLIATLLAVMLIFAACQSKPAEKNEANTTTEAKTDSKEPVAGEEGTFVVGMECGYAPFNWTQMDDSNGAVPIFGLKEFAGGYDVEIAKKIAEGLGKQLVVKKMEWDGLQPSIQSKKIDAIVAGMSPSAERKEVMDFTNPYYDSDLVVVVKADGAFKDSKSLKDFAGAKITAMMNTLHYQAIDQIDGVSKQEPMPDFPAMRVALEAGKIDGYISEKPEGISASAANENFIFNDLTDGFVMESEETTVAVAVDKGSDLVEKINEILKGISQEERDKLMENAIKNQPSNQ